MPRLALVALSIAGVALGALSAVALVADHTVHQQGRKFSFQSAIIKKGTPLTFVNDDTVPHNVASTTKGNEFDLGSQPPGASTDVTFTEAGEVQVICAIHPRMRMMVSVRD
ncbi:hypothetical protein JQ600_09415 [Bradyrhizobium sp. AUGA SZCCT0176]|uniref:plastocyanin/azurin family copper-binding protein n=1 Tax=Bradyrhizobium sp. AUGA SZCCT0176 TaxID=2807664 RepID=UPI001BA807E0|nr:plastocyanin/azurin family copper-binding protein [Bradyrhizobium sp. AUGA SZCCT0176]MBR1225134.1 hypothetical protein [Bradyrhizobium sp. AUGA SZCCT0176]